ncbi:MAG: phytanoyl-CoA dioxygenase family protein, partial [Nitrososphaera sp.]|nr:phytanoyl-CoA dioxygenase family protein [Nitrososphaera sp.]
DRIDIEYRAKKGLGPHDPLNLLDFMGKDELFLELIDYPKTFPKVWGILGWHIQLYHSHMIVTPPRAFDEKPVKKRLNWHQDSGRLNLDLETNPRPRISLKIAYFLTDTTEMDRANLYIIPGSHLQNKVEFPVDGVSDPEGATAIQVRSGSAVFFDRRLWHASSPNFSKVTRKVLFYGYSYRWLRPRDDMTVSHYMDRCDPIRRQLLGASTGGFGYTTPSDEDVPLRTWLKEHLGEEAVVP